MVDKDKCLISLTNDLFHWSWYFPQAMSAWQSNWHVQPKQQISHSVHWVPANLQEHAALSKSIAKLKIGRESLGKAHKLDSSYSDSQACRTLQGLFRSSWSKQEDSNQDTWEGFSFLILTTHFNHSKIQQWEMTLSSIGRS